MTCSTDSSSEMWFMKLKQANAESKSVSAKINNLQKSASNHLLKEL